MTAPSTDRAAVTAIIRAVKAAGWILDYVDDGEDNIAVASETEALDAIFAVDEAWLHVEVRPPYDGPPRVGYVYFVLGNEPFEVAADYTINLEPALGPLFERWDS